MARRRTWRLMTRMVLAGVVVFALALPAPSRAGAPAMSLAPLSGPPGSGVLASGTGLLPALDAVVLWGPPPGVVVGGPTPVEDDESVSIPFNVPEDAVEGAHVVRLCIQGSGPTGCDGPSASATFQVALLPPEPTPDQVQTPTPSPTPTPIPTPTPLPTPTFPLGAETPTPEPPPLVAVTPAPTPPNQIAENTDDFPDLWVKEIEVTQGIQDLQNRMPLVEDRRTYARVYVGVIGRPEWGPTHGALEARRNGQQVGWIWAENGPISAKLGAGSRVEVDDSLNFRLPESWLHGEVTLTAFVYSYQVKTVWEDEPDQFNNIAAVTVEFHPANPLTVHLAPIHLHRSFHPDDVDRTYDGELDADFIGTGGSATMRAVYGLYRFHPLAQVNVDSFTAAVTPLGHGSGHEFDLGWCRTTLIEAQAGNVVDIADWEPLVDDPDALDPEPGSAYEADNDVLAILDRRIEVSHWYVNEDGTATVYGSLEDSSGPSPLPGTPVIVGGCHQEPQVSQEANQTLALYRVYYDWDDEEDLFVGMVHPSLPSHFAGLSTGGTDSVWVRMRDDFGVSNPWDHSSSGVLAHEAAHAAGLNHVPCLDNDDDGVPDELAGGALDPSHPNALTFPNCALADVDPDGYYGFDVYWSLFGLDGPTVISNNPGQAAPNAAWPMLSYRNPGWADPYHYCRLLEFYGVPCDPTDLGIPWSEPDAAAGGPLTAPLDPTHGELPPGSSGLIGLRGSFDPETGTGSMEGAYVLTDPTESAMRRYAGQYVIADAHHFVVALDASGAELARVPIRQHNHSHLDKTIVDFEILVPYFTETVEYQMGESDLDFVRLRASPNGPTVTPRPIDATGRYKVIFPWDASDADGDLLTYTVLYAPDGEHWQVLADGLTVSEYEVDLASLPRGEAPVFQVIAFDGSRAASATSGPIDGIDGLPPRVVVDALTGASYPSGADVVLRASAFDAEDRLLGGDALSWSSSVDGELGAGTELVVSDLGLGGHTITVTATDSDGLTDADSFELLIDPDVVQPQPDPELEADVAAIFDALAAGEDPADAIDGGLDPALILVLAGVALIAVGVLGTVLLRRRRASRSPEPPPPPAASPPSVESPAA